GMAQTATLITASEFLADPVYEGGWELIDGVPVEKCMGVRANTISLVIQGEIWQAMKADKGRGLSPDQRYKLWPDRPNRVRVPDASYFVPSRVPDADLNELTVAPDLVVEVVSTHEAALDTERKLTDYLQAGVRLVWVIYPETQTIHVYGQDGLAALLSAGDTLSGHDVLPSFNVSVASLFPDR
ncbi:MAG: Uma2 family endonuclease, partial [Dehalococcoidia bacterium]